VLTNKKNPHCAYLDPVEPAGQTSVDIFYTAMSKRPKRRILLKLCVLVTTRGYDHLSNDIAGTFRNKKFNDSRDVLGFSKSTDRDLVN